MFLDELHVQLCEQGFLKVQSSQQGCFVYTREAQEQNEFIILVNLPDSLPEDIGFIQYSLEQLKSELQGNTKSEFLFIYISSETQKIKCLCEHNEDIHWIVSREERKLIIYENQKGTFEKIRFILEDVLAGNIYRKKRNSFVTYGIIAVNIIVYVFMYIICKNTQRQEIIETGGLYWPLAVNQKEYYRLFMSMFLHSGFTHLFNNMLLLYFIGSFVEECIGHAKFAFLYFVSGILAGAVSMGYNMFYEKFVLSIGASGAIFGVVGAITCFIFLSKGMIRSIEGPRYVIFIGLSIWNGVEAPDVDNMAHIGGFLSGILIGVLFIACRKRKKNPIRI
ncbi:rhomboid family intramembrane serine protease [[Clostridium] polysaccharolyticum]|jgi:rhomboid protease GluP|uniref:Membrane associated serine protease, rhomboid family n=1 Tax=[Clostridium] polysaccharolyticum TaxID=29364 RepID=A0A1I0D9W6_9FIRM|nr:rhomboid family intramembrane serine protease [[Clostridium] polysaccharolyticum]SET28999.1 Membrane associated serine protease, rhomboid family [[Clostridium] polysaccharolyticum]